MYNLARVLVVGDDVANSRELSRRLRREGYATSASDYSVVTERLSRDEHPDVVVVSSNGSVEAGCDLADVLKSDSDTAHIPIIMVTDDARSPTCRRCLAVGVDDLVAPPVSDIILLSRLRPLVRLATMRGELQQRAATARAFALDVDTRLETGGDTDYRVLVVDGAREDDRAVIDGALGEGYRLTRAEDPFAAGEMLLTQDFDALVLGFDGAADDALYLCGQVRNNPRLFNLPVLLIADPEAFPTVDEPYKAGANIVLGRPVDQDRLQAGLLTLVRRQKMRRVIREKLAAIRQESVCDPLTGVYTREFMLAHLARLGSAARMWHKHLSVVSFQVQNRAGIARAFGAAAADDVVRQVSEWILALVRAEDLVARTADNEFAVVLPDTAPAEAEVVAHRISGVLLHTEFGLKGVNEPVSVWLQSGCAGFHLGDTPDSLLARARHNLR